MINFLSAFGYFMRGVFTIGIAVHVAIHWLVIVALLGVAVYGLWLAGSPVLAALFLGLPALLGYRAWRDGH